VNRLRWILAAIGATTIALVGLDVQLDRREAARRAARRAAR
jgi:hypothetical protein